MDLEKKQWHNINYNDSIYKYHGHKKVDGAPLLRLRTQTNGRCCHTEKLLRCLISDLKHSKLLTVRPYCQRYLDIQTAPHTLICKLLISIRVTTRAAMCIGTPWET